MRKNIIKILLGSFFLCALFSDVILSQSPTKSNLSENHSLKYGSISLENKVAALEKKIEKPSKDIWDKLSALSGLISGILIAFIGGIATYVYRERQLAITKSQKERELAILQVQTVQGFMPQLQSNDEKQIEAALLAIAALGNSKLATDLASLFRTEGSVQAISKIASSEPKETNRAVEMLISTLISDEKAVVRGSAAHALGQIGDTKALPVLLESLNDQDLNVRGSAANALGRLRDKRAVETLIALLSNDEAESVRGSAANALGEIGDQKAIAALTQALEMDASEIVRGTAANALGQIKKGGD